jgi:putative flippase GtrA
MRKAVMTLALANLREGTSSTLVSRRPVAAARPRPRAVETRRFGRFLVVGLGGTLIDFGLLALLTGIGVPTLLANTLSFSAGACSNFTWNRLWTFAEARRRPWGVQLVQFLAVSAVGLAINDAIVMMLQTPLGNLLGHPAQGYLPAKVVATGVAVVWNFLANRYWTFAGVDGHAV